MLSSFSSFLTLLLKEPLQAEVILWRSCSHIICHFHRKHSAYIFTNCIYVAAGSAPAAISQVGKLGTLSNQSIELLRFQCVETCMHMKFSLCTDTTFSQPLPELSVPNRVEGLQQLHHCEPVQMLSCHLKRDLTRYHSTDHPHAFKTEEKGRQGLYLLPGCEC